MTSNIKQAEKALLDEDISDIPIILFASTENEKKSAEVMHELLCTNGIQHAECAKGQVYSCVLNTKYYTANVTLSVVPIHTAVDNKLIDPLNVDALVFHFSSALSAANMSSVRGLCALYNPSIKLLVCPRVSDGDRDRERLMEFVVTEQCELVELDPDTESRQEAEEYAELIGYKRVWQVLQSHAWSNAQVKSEARRPPFRPTDSDNISDTDEQEVKPVVSTTATDHKTNSSDIPQSSKQAKDEEDDLNLDEKMLAALAQAGDSEEDMKFEDLFAKLGDMKVKAETMNEAERKAYAEQVAMAFMRACGEEEELDSELE